MTGPASPRRVVLLPVGATEAHGPHLPLDTDTRIATLLAERVAETLPGAVVAPPFIETACAYAASFPGTVDAGRAREVASLRARLDALAREGATRVVLVNLHFDPEHMLALKEVVEEARAKRPGLVVFPNFARRAHAQAIGGEFATGACHGGEFETSLMLLAAPDLVLPLHRALPSREVDLAAAIREGKRSFREIGLHDAYCGHPARASAEEGKRVLEILARIVLAEIAREEGF